MAKCPPPKMHPSVEATLSDFLKNGAVERIRANPHLTPEEIHDDFNSRYHVDGWNISTKMFTDYMLEVLRYHRCTLCGTKTFPYFIQGDSLCITCEQDN